MEKKAMTKEQLYKALNLVEQKDSTKSSTKKELYKLSDKVVSLITERIKDEYRAHFLYRSAANWCHDKNYKKAANFFDEDANTELEHAQKLQKYLTDFNIFVPLPTMESKFEFESLPEIIYKAYDVELALMESYTSSSHEIFKEDLITFDFFQEFRQIQMNSVIEFNDLINGLDLIDKNDKFQLLYFEQTYF